MPHSGRLKPALPPTPCFLVLWQRSASPLHLAAQKCTQLFLCLLEHTQNPHRDCSNRPWTKTSSILITVCPTSGFLPIHDQVPFPRKGSLTHSCCVALSP